MLNKYICFLGFMQDILTSTHTILALSTASERKLMTKLNGVYQQ